MKRKLTEDQEFQVFKLVLDKFLWIGFAVMIYGVVLIATEANWGLGALWMLGGIVLLMLLVRFLTKGYEIKKLTER